MVNNNNNNKNSNNCAVITLACSLTALYLAATLEVSVVVLLAGLFSASSIAFSVMDSTICSYDTMSWYIVWKEHTEKQHDCFSHHLHKPKKQSVQIKNIMELEKESSYPPPHPCSDCEHFENITHNHSLPQSLILDITGQDNSPKSGYLAPPVTNLHAFLPQFIQTWIPGITRTKLHTFPPPLIQTWILGITSDKTSCLTAPIHPNWIPSITRDKTSHLPALVHPNLDTWHHQGQNFTPSCPSSSKPGHLESLEGFSLTLHLCSSAFFSVRSALRWVSLSRFSMSFSQRVTWS